MKFLKIFLIVVLVVLAIAVLLVIAAVTYAYLIKLEIVHKPFYTEDIANYYTGSTGLTKVELPQTAEVVSYSRFSDTFYDGDVDEYLELKFSNVDELEKYLSAILEKAEERYHRTIGRELTEEHGYCLEPNPYNANYTDIINYNTHSLGGNIYHMGYSIRPGEYSIYDTIYSIISYSIEELTVIQTISSGAFFTMDRDYIPKYFTRFNVPLDQPVERWIRLERTPSSEESIQAAGIQQTHALPAEICAHKRIRLPHAIVHN